MEEEHPHRAQSRVPVEMDVVSEGLTLSGEGSAVGELAAEQAIHALAAVVLDVHALPGREEQVRLTGLDEHAPAEVPVLERPCVGGAPDVRLRPDTPATLNQRVPGDTEDTVTQEQGWRWHPNDTCICILRCERRPERS